MTTPEFQDFQPELTLADELLLVSYRTTRFYDAYPELMQCIVFYSCLDSKVQLIASDGKLIERLYALLPELRRDVYVVFGAETICFRSGQTLVLQESTRSTEPNADQHSGVDLSAESTLMFNNSADLNLTNMASTTVAPEKPGVEIAQTNASLSQLQPMQRLENMKALTAKAGIDLSYAIERFQALGLFIGTDQNQETFTTWEAWSKFADHYANNLKSLLGVPSTAQLVETPLPMNNAGSEAAMPTTNGKAPGTQPPRRSARKTTVDRKPTKAAKTPRPTAQLQPAVKAKELTPSMRFKNFKPSNGAEKTLGNFLEAQAFEPTNRIQIIEAIAAAPEEVNTSDAGTMTERVIDKIMQVCKKTGNRLSRVKLIQAAKGMTSSAG